MKEKTLLQVWGKADSGKTSTIKIVNHELKKTINVSHSYSFPLESGEVLEIYDYKGIKIGVSSMGDVLHDYLEQFLNKCFDECDIFIAASRVYNDVDKYLSKECAKKSFRRIKVTNYRIETDSKQKEFDFNQISARHIHSLIDQIILGSI